MARWMRDALAPRPTRWVDLRPTLERRGAGPLIDEFLAGRLHWSRLWAPYVLARFASV